ncbi:hypothetical protein AB0P21_18595 [Kribbella sp. NPDC056861]|uniref:hypothetical protein n=1 Tax=Kribbella sp. NPDC056861 TaxID=3154857 RepID=UPI003443E991
MAVLVVALAWYETNLIAGGTPAALIPIVAVVLTGWWREAGLVTVRPTTRWLLAVPPALGFLFGSQPDPSFRVVGGVLLVEGFAQFALRWHGPWRSTAIIVVLHAPVVLAGSPRGAPTELALLLVLIAVRWQVWGLWPVLVIALVFPSHDPLWFVATIVCYGILLLWWVPAVAMSTRPTVRVLILDDRDRILLLGWHDPVDGSRAWDLPAAESPEPRCRSRRPDVRFRRRRAC